MSLWKKMFGNKKDPGNQSPSGQPEETPPSTPGAPSATHPPTGSVASPGTKPGSQPDAAKQRVVRVFISSTFRDMQAERDELMLFVFPELRKRCRERFVEFTEIDLRWGITEEESKKGQVLPICLEEIKRCRPYFIGLLGGRYGWVPDNISPELIEQEPWLKEHLGKTGKSVTELEILHGVLNNPDMAEHAFFYFRDPSYIKTVPQEKLKDFTAEGAEDAEKLKRLKDAICTSKFREQVRENYPNPKELGELVLNDLWEVIDKRFPKEEVPSALERERMDHEAFAVVRQKVYIGRDEYFKQLDEHVVSEKPPLVVLGESGSGKSALIANWVDKYRKEQPDDFLVAHYIGGTADSANHIKILQRIMEEIWDRYGPREKKGMEEGIRSIGKEKEDEIPTDPKKVVEVFPLWLAKTRGTFILVLDALNQLEDTDNALDLRWLPEYFPPNVRVILSTLPTEKEGDFTAENAKGAEKEMETKQAWKRPYDALKRRGWHTLNVELLSTDERKKLIEDYLARFTRKLSQNNIEKIIAAPQTSNPLYLKALLDELRVYGDHETLPQRIEHYLEATTVDDLYEKILERYEKDYERESEQKGMVRRAMSLIWASRRGLSDSEILELLGKEGKPLPRVYWSPLYLAAEESLVNRSGLLNFFHDFMRKAVEDRYLRDPEQGAVLPPPLTPPAGGGERLVDKIVQTGDSNISSPLPAISEAEGMGEGKGGGELLSKQKRKAHLQLANYFEKKPLDDRQADELPWLLWKAESRDRLRACLLDIDRFLMIRERNQEELMGYWVFLGEERVMGKAYLRCFESWSEGKGRHKQSISNAAGHLSFFLFNAANHAEAEPLMRRALRIDEQSFGENHPNVAISLNNLAGLLYDTNRLSEAEPLMRRTLRIDEQSFGENHPKVAIRLDNLAQLLLATNRLSEAEPLMRRALRIFESSLGAEHTNVATQLNNLAQLLQATNRLLEAEPLMRRALRIDEQIFGENHPNVARDLNNLATLLHATNRLYEAAPLSRH
ncbi:MAG: tetratricopeptide repeat protein, partial [Planctomycetes bacterium]|nr:tetratricopeptide repeat protein [Planctomycetota bacterium]